MKHGFAKPNLPAIKEDLMEPFSQMEHAFANPNLADITEYLVKRFFSDETCSC